MPSPSDFQRQVFNTLAILGLSQVQIHRQRNGSFRLKTSPLLKRLLYFALRVNMVLKVGFLILLSGGFFQTEFEFFEVMAIVLWFLILILISTAERLWYRKYPFFEILTAWWIVEERVYDRLGRPEQFLRDIKRIGISTCLFQSVVAVVGVLAVAVQYDAAPKYCVFAYSIIETEDPVLKWIFGAHDLLFVTHAWLVYGAVIYVSSVLGAELTYNIEALSEVMSMFVTDGRRGLAPAGRIQPASTEGKRKRYSGGLMLLEQDHEAITRVKSVKVPWWNVKFTPITLLKEYSHIHLTVTQLNRFTAYNFLYMHACSYIQMISDVFQLIQILRIPEASISDAMFFAEDMMVCMYMLFRCFKSMAFLHPCSTAFQEKYRELLALPPRAAGQVGLMDRKLLEKLKPTLHDTAFRLGPCKMKVGFVGQAMDVLLQYYICVALWK